MNTHAASVHPAPPARTTHPEPLPVLWHLKVSNYNEKARWALDYKRVPHRRSAALAGFHPRTAKKLTGGGTLPILVLDGQAIGDSTRIIETLEKRYPEPALYPSDPEQRRRALELEDFFDEQLGPQARQLFIHHVLSEPTLFIGAFFPDFGGGERALARATFPLTRAALKRQFGINPAGVAASYERLGQAGARFRAELTPSGYLVGDRFTVADLALAALLSPLVAPPEFPYPQPQRQHPRLEPLRQALDREGLLEWVREMYARHRGSSAEVA